MQGINALAYFATTTAKNKKSFMALPPGGDDEGDTGDAGKRDATGPAAGLHLPKAAAGRAEMVTGSPP